MFNFRSGRRARSQTITGPGRRVPRPPRRQNRSGLHPGAKGLLVATALGIAPLAMDVARADSGEDLLYGSSQAMVLGPTGIPDPATFSGYLPTIDQLYLEPLGFSADGDLTTLVTPESLDFGPSIADGELDLINAVEADYQGGYMSAQDPLTIVTYSQSTVIASQAEPVLHELGIPSDDLRFVMLGDATADPSTGATGILDTLGDTTFGRDMLDLLGWGNLIDAQTPNDLYPTDVYTVTGDFWADYPVSAEYLWLPGLLEHGDYMGLSESAIQSAMNDATTTLTDGLTTYYTLPDPVDLIATLIQTAFADIFG